jgi:maleate cis-trans isomerase
MNEAQRVWRLGIIAAPGWADPTGAAIAQLHPGQVEVAQTILGPPGFDYSFAQYRALEPELRSAAQLLAEAGSEIILQVGPAVAYHAGGSPEGIRALTQRIATHCDVPVTLNGGAVLDCLGELGARVLAAACPYYSEAWKQAFLAFYAQAGFQVPVIQSFLDQGLYASQEAIDARRWQFSDDEVDASLARTRRAAPQADALVVSGAGIRTLPRLAQLRRALGLPVVSADYALYRAFLRHTKLPARV